MARSKPTDATAPSGKAGRGPKDGGRGRSSGSTAASAGASGKASGKAPKLDKKGRPKVGRLKKVGAQARMIKQAYTLTHKNDRKLPWIMLIAFVVAFAVVELIGILLNSPFLFLPLAIVVGALTALIVFGRRAQGSAYRQVEGQPGAAAWVLEGMRGPPSALMRRPSELTSAAVRLRGSFITCALSLGRGTSPSPSPTTMS